MGKTAVILFNLGGPDKAESVRPFLMNFFMDKNIIRLPYPLRFGIASMIARRRSQREAKESYGELGGGSPLLQNSTQQAEALQEKLGEDYKIFICMRYWHPMAPEVVQQVKDYDPENVVLMPLYPQYSTTTTRSSYQVWQKALKDAGLKWKTDMVCCYADQEGYVQASAENIKPLYEQCIAETGQAPRVLFSAHGLPESIIRAGDPYQWQCELSAAKIAEKLNIEGLDWQMCYQSRVGPQKWLGPSTEEAIEKAVHDNVPVLIYPHAFTQEHVETLVELDVEYKEIAEDKNIKGYYRAPTVGVHPAYIKGLADMVKKAGIPPPVSSSRSARACPAEFGQCCMQQFGTAK